MKSFYSGNGKDSQSGHSCPDKDCSAVVMPKVLALLDSLSGFSFYFFGGLR